jgi:threonine dehydratase
MLDTLTPDAIREASARIRGRVLRTPTLRRRPRPGLELWLKAESLQHTGAFKLRGAFNLMLQLPAGGPGIVAHSSGNHAQAVAWAAARLGLRASIVMPLDAPASKRARTEAEGAEVIEVGPDSAERARCARDLAAERGLVLVPPFDDVRIAAGAGTAALELTEDAEPLDRFYAPIGGGGLISGCAVAVHGVRAQTEVVGVEPDDANSVKLGLASGERTTVPPPHTLADGLRVRTPGEQTWPLIQKHVARVELVSDEELLDAMAWALRELRLVLEPSGAASLAAALREGQGRCGVLLSGGNVEPELLARVASR